ncbi:hypothetical protein K239x_16960 [Planctomycetes bacterium K23_9]|uniref:Uncharacterized protein n=1 Tax=Stieleria marina TaxID=1930275 RepID=A0A517NRL0_9BACT|nr:hypothetical protein K239x_16960 [Planctomycetes bacterium K23_9]
MGHTSEPERNTLGAVTDEHYVIGLLSLSIFAALRVCPRPPRGSISGCNEFTDERLLAAYEAFGSQVLIGKVFAIGSNPVAGMTNPLGACRTVKINFAEKHRQARSRNGASCLAEITSALNSKHETENCPNRSSQMTIIQGGLR